MYSIEIAPLKKQCAFLVKSPGSTQQMGCDRHKLEVSALRNLDHYHSEQGDLGMSEVYPDESKTEISMKK